MEKLSAPDLIGKNEIQKTVIQVPFVDLKRQYILLREEIMRAVDEVFLSGGYILGNVVETFEKKVADYLGCRFVLGVANGTDAIILALKAMGVDSGDEVILPANSFIATAGAVAAVDAQPVLCDIQDDLNIDVTKIEAVITKKTKAIIPVHLTGRPAEMDAILKIAAKYSLKVIEDAAQSIGASYKGKMTGGLSDVGCFSLHPLKNLRVYGDGGLITTNNEALYHQMKLLRNHGLQDRDTCVTWGLNSRLDSMQAAIGQLNLLHLEKWNNRRRDIAQQYQNKLKHVVEVPQDKFYEHAVYHNFVIFAEHRDELMQFLLARGIETKIHYPIPIHLQPAASGLKYKKGDFPVVEKASEKMLSLPVYAELQDEEVLSVIDAVLSFYQSKK